MDRILLTVEGPQERMEVAVPADVPVAQVVPMVRDLCAPGRGAGELAVGLRGYGPLPADRSLSELGVEEGSTLYLCARDGSTLTDAGPPAGAPTALNGGNGRAAGVAEAPPPAPAVPDSWAPEPAGAVPADAPAPTAPAGPAPAPAGLEAFPPEPPSEPRPGELWSAAPLSEKAPSPSGAWSPPAAVPPPAPAAGPDPLPVPVSPPAMAGATPPSPTVRQAPAPVPLAERLREATTALVGSSTNLASPGPVGGPPTPAMLARRRNVGPLDRARRAWESSDYRRQLDRVIAAPRLARCATLAVASPKGGVGKTSIAALLGTLLAMIRTDRVIAVDSNPDHGTLGRSLTPDHPVFVDDLAGVLEHPALTATLLDGSLGRAAHGLMVLPAPTDPERMMRLDADSYARVIERLQTLAGILVLDCGAGLYNAPTQAALDGADEIVLVTDSDPLTAAVVVEAAQRLHEAGKPVFAVVNRIQEGPGQVDVGALAGHLAFAKVMVTVPADVLAARQLGVGAFDWHRAPRPWQVAIRELAAAIVGDWGERGLGA